MVEQPSLDCQCLAVALPHEATGATTGGDHAMTRHDDGYGVSPAGAPHGPRRAAERQSKLSIAARAAAGDTAQRLPHALLKGRPLCRQGKIEPPGGIFKVMKQLVQHLAHGPVRNVLVFVLLFVIFLLIRMGALRLGVPEE